MGGTPALPVLDTVTLAVCQHVADRLESEAADLAATMTTAVVNEIPEYTTAAAPGQRQIVFEHSLDHVYAVVRAVRTWSLPAGPELAFVRERAALRATQHVPLSALLHSYRLGHRTVWERLVQLLAGQDNILDASLAQTTLTLSYAELISGVLAEGYVERQRQLLVQIDRDQRDFLEDVLRGTFERQVDSPRLTSTFALVPGADFLVLVVHACPTESGPHAGDSLTRAAETLKRHFDLGVAQPFVVVRHAEIISIAPVARARPAAIARCAPGLPKWRAATRRRASPRTPHPPAGACTPCWSGASVTTWWSGRTERPCAWSHRRPDVCSTHRILTIKCWSGHF